MNKEELNIYQRLALIRDAVSGVAKSKKGYGYTYVDVNDVLEVVRPYMKRYGVSLVPSIKSNTMVWDKIETEKTDKTKDGKLIVKKSIEHVVRAEAMFRWVNNDKPAEYIEIPWVVIGSQSDPSQAFGAGETYCMRYFLINFFQIPQADSSTDVDEIRSNQKKTEESIEKEILKATIDRLNTRVTAYLADNPDKKDEIAKFIGKYVKGGNYFNIKNIEIASKLSGDFCDTYMSDKED